MKPGANALKDLRAAALAEICKPGSEKLFAELHSQRRRRSRRTWTPPVLRWEGKDDAKYSPLTPPPGSLTLYWAPAGSPLLRRLRGAILTQNLRDLKTIHDEISPQFAKRSVGDLSKTIDSLLGAPSFFDLRYAGSTLAQYLWLSDSAPLGSVTLPYNGGPIDTAELAIVEYCPDPKPKPPQPVPPTPFPPSPWEAILILHEPRLTPLEKRVLEAVPVSQSEIHIGASGTVAATPATLVVIAVFVAINTAVTTCCDPFRDRLAEVVNPADEVLLRAASPELAAAELLDIRASVFDEFGVM